MITLKEAFGLEDDRIVPKDNVGRPSHEELIWAVRVLMQKVDKSSIPPQVLEKLTDISLGISPKS